MNRLLCCLMAAVAAFGVAVRTDAATTRFIVDPTRSSLTITPSTLLFGTTPLPTYGQAPESLTTTYTGKILADVNPLTLQLLSSSVAANNSGNWRPGTDYSQYLVVPYPADDGYINAHEPANYGVIADLSLIGGAAQGETPLTASAIRDIVLSFSDDLPKALLPGGTFLEGGMDVDFTSGVAWLSSGGPGTDGRPVTNLPPLPTFTTTETLDPASLVTSGNQSTLTIPVDFTVTYQVAVLIVSTRYQGTITAVVPEPTAFASFASIGGLGMTFLRRRAKARS